MKAHLKRLAIPTTWPIAKKSNKFITRPLPGASMDLSMPLNLIFRDVLEIANTSKEVKHILQNNYVFVNGIQKKNPKQNLSFMDVLEMKGTGKAYRMLLNKKGKLYLSQIEEHEAKYRPNKIVGKKIL